MRGGEMEKWVVEKLGEILLVCYKTMIPEQILLSDIHANWRSNV